LSLVDNIDLIETFYPSGFNIHIMKNIFLLLIVLIAPFATFGAKLYVTNTNDAGAGSLREVVTVDAQAGDTVYIDVAGTLTLQTGIGFTKDITIIGPGPIHFNIDMSLINGGVESGFNFITGSFGFELDGIGFNNGTASCIGVNSAFLGTLTVKNCLFESIGGTAVNIDGGNAIFEGCSFVDNTSPNEAGAVLFWGNSGTFTNCTFFQNDASFEGGAMQVAAGSVDLINNTFLDNGMTMSGGTNARAIQVKTGATVNLRNNIITQASGSGINQMIINDGGTINSQGGNVTRDNGSGDFTATGSDLTNTLVTLGNEVNDGWGLVYFPYADNASPGINIDQTPAGLPVYDQRRVWRVMDDGTGNEYADAGAVEYTPLTVTQAGGSSPGTLEDNFLSVYPTLVGKKAFVFEINSAGAQFCPTGLASFNLTSAETIINGFSQNDSRVPGPGTSSTNVTGGLTNVIINNAQGIPMDGIVVSANNCVIAGVSCIDYGFGGSGIKNNAYFTEISGCHLGISANGSSQFSNDYGIIVGEFGSTKIGSGHYCGHLYHSNRNVISGNANAQIAVLGGEEQDIKHNYIGLASDGISAPVGTPHSSDTGIAFRPYISINNPNFIGGYDATDYNVIGGNNYGVSIATGDNFVLNNVIGGTLTGEAISGNTKNTVGVSLYGTDCFNNRIGDANAGNTIIGNDIGIQISNEANFNEVYSNHIGVSIYGNIALGNIYEGVHITSSGTTDNRIGDPGLGNVISSNETGIRINDQATFNVIASNLIGLSGDGLDSDMGNTNDGIYIEDFGTNDNLIGYTTAGNIIGYNGTHGIAMSYDCQHSILHGNIIGLQTDTISEAGNDLNGIFINNSSGYNKIGGCALYEGNYIGHNGEHGIVFEGFGADHDTVYGNKIGIAVDGSDAGNDLSGIAIVNSVNNIQIGSTSAGCGNEIAFNEENGIVLSSICSGIEISGNSVHDNLILGIDIDEDGTPDYTTDDGLMGNDATPIGLVNSCITCGGNTSFTITPESTALVHYEVFKADGDSEEGDSLIFTWSGNLSYYVDTTITMPFALPDGMDLVMTARIGNSTSEFGPTFTVSSPLALTPAISNNTICPYPSPSPDVSVTGEVGIPVWFSDAGMTTRLGSGNPFTVPFTDVTATGSYSYFVSDSVPGCYGPISSAVTMTVVPARVYPITGLDTICTDGNYQFSIDRPVTFDLITWTFSPEGTPGTSFHNSINFFNPLPGSEEIFDVDTYGAFDSGINDTITVEIDSAGCISNSIFPVSVVFSAQPDSDSLFNPTTCGGSDGYIGVGGLTPAQTMTLYHDGGTSTAITVDANGWLFLTGLGAGNYDFDSIDNGNCMSFVGMTFTLTDPVPPLITGVTHYDPVTCGGNGLAVIYLTPGSNTGPYTIDLDGGTTVVTNITNTSDSLIVSGLLDGQTILNPVVTDEVTLCTDTFTYSGTFSDPLPPTASAGPDVTICEGDVANLTGGPVGGGFTYSWDNGGGATMNTSVSPLTTTTYTLTVTETATGCVGNDQADVIVNPLPIISGESDICSGQTINLLPNTGGTWVANNPTDFTIDNTGLVTAVGFGSGDFTFTDANGCLSTSSVIAINPTPYEGNPFVTDASCAGGFDGDIMILPAGSYTHSWVGPNSFTATTQDITGLEAGSYTNTMTDIGTGCVGTYTGVVGEPTQIIISVTTVDVACNGMSDGSLTIIASNGTPPYQYSIDGISFVTSNTFTGLVAGNYTCYVEDANGCAVNTIEAITEPATPVAATAVVTSNYNGADISCAGLSDGEMTVTPSGGTPGYSYQWYVGASPIAGATSAVITNQSANSYSVDVTDINGCFINTSVTLTEPLIVALSGGADQSLCEGSSVNLSALASDGTGTFTYSWSPISGLDDPNINNPIASPVVTTTYSVTATDVNGCVQVDDVVITVNPQPNISGSHTDPLCFGGTDGSITLVASGGQAPYQYSVNAGVSYTTSGTFSGLSNGSSVCRIQDANGCESSDTTIVINNPSELLFTSILKEDTCSQGVGEITINATGGFPTYSFSIDNGGGYSGSNVFGGLTPGSYDLLVQDANGCVSSVSAEIINDLNGVQVSMGNNSPQVSCFGDANGLLEATIDADPFGGINFNWTLGGSPYATTQNLSGLSAGVYQLIATDAGGCKDTLDYTISEPALLIGAWLFTDESCSGYADGVVDTTSVQGGTAPYTLDWFELPSNTNVGSTAPLSNLQAGDYVGVITDSYGCELRDTVTVSAGETYTASVVIASQTGACVGNNTFDFADDNSVPPSGGANFSWVFPGATPATSSTQSPTGIVFTSGGVHTVTYEVTSLNGCVFSDDLDVTIGEVSGVNAGLDQTICEGEIANLVGVPNSAAYSYSWAVGMNPWLIEGTTANITVNPTTSIYYVLTVTETSTGCTGSDSLSIIVNPIPDPSIDQLGPIDLCETEDGNYVSLTATSSDVPAGTFNWFVGSTTASPVSGAQLDLDNSNVGNHTIYLQESSSAGCTSYFDSIQLTFVANDLELTAASTFCLGDEVLIDATGSGAIIWVNSQGEIADTMASSTTANPTADNTIYYVEMDMDGCIFVDSLLLNLDPNCGNAEISVNAFSPDGDGVNDQFMLDIPSLLNYDNNVSIFNRWGDEIGSFQNYNNADVSWDGKNKAGVNVTNGTYFYVIEIPELNIKESGWIQVVR
jgi:gliding motility-associated-like protein